MLIIHHLYPVFSCFLFRQKPWFILIKMLLFLILLNHMLLKLLFHNYYLLIWIFLVPAQIFLLALLYALQIFFFGLISSYLLWFLLAIIVFSAFFWVLWFSRLLDLIYLTEIFVFYQILKVVLWVNLHRFLVLFLPQLHLLFLSPFL